MWNISSSGEEPKPRIGGRPAGEAAQTIAPGFSTSLRERVLLAVFLRAESDEGLCPAPTPARILFVRRSRAGESFARGTRRPRCPSERFSPITVGGPRLTASGHACARAPAGRSLRAAGPKAGPACPPSRSISMRPREVRGLLAEGRPFHARRVVAFVAPGRGAVAFIAGRRVGGAVQRNRARRVLRAAWRELAPGIDDTYDIAWVARAAVLGAKTQDLVADMRELLRRARVMPA
jgi:ribonuclease P protein component